MAIQTTHPGAPVSERRAHVSHGVEMLGRVGFAAQGVIYMVIGLLAVRAAVWSGNLQDASSTGAIQEIARQPFGRVLLAIVSVGLLAYVFWRLIQAIVDPENHGHDAKALVKRAGFFVVAMSYAALAFLAGSIALRAGSSASAAGDSREEWTARLMSMPFGQWLVGLAGAIVVGVGAVNACKAGTARFMDEYNRPAMKESARKLALWSGRLGHGARAVTFWIIGGFMIVAAYRADPDETTGLTGALQTLAEQPYGPWLLGAVAIGLAAFGVQCIVKARYRDFNLNFR